MESNRTDLESILAAIPGEIYWKDMNGVYQGCSDAQIKLSGCSKASEVIGKTDYELAWKNSADQLRRNDLLVIKTGKLMTFEEIVTLDNGAQIFFLSNKAPWRDTSGNIIGIIGSSIDISAQTQKQLALVEQVHVAEHQKRITEIFLKNVISNLPDHVFWEDKEGRFLGCNDQQAKNIGFEKAEDIVGKTIWDIAKKLDWTDEMIQNLRANDLEVMNTGKTISVEESAMWANGVTRTFLSKKAPLRDDHGNCIGILGLSFDITELKKIELELRREKKQAESANLAKSDFIANISHDIRTPLHAILGTAELLKLKAHLPEQSELLDAIIQSGETLSKLIENVLDFSKLEQGPEHLPEELIDLESLLNTLVLPVRKTANQKGIDIIIDYPRHIPRHLFSNADALRRIFINLLGNAIKFTHEGSISIHVSIANASENTVILEITVKDTGIGIAQNELNHIFDRFYRANPSYQGKYQGSGLGLAIIKKIVENLKGSIQVESCLGVGSKFVCTLPFKFNRHATINPTPKYDLMLHRNTSPKKLSVLLVEDATLTQKFSISLLEMMGCNVQLASTVIETLQATKKQFDLIFMDIGLPDGDGLALIQELRKIPLHTNTTIIALTAHAGAEIKSHCINAGANDFLTKPASYKALLTCINQYLK